MDDKQWVVKQPVLKTMLKLGLPIGVTQALQVVYSLTDMYWLGRLGREALAAVNATWPVLFLVIAGLAGLFQAGLALVSQYWGAGDYKRSLNAGGQLLVIAVGAGVPLGILSYMAIPVFLELIGVPGEVREGAVTYGRIFALGFAVFGLMESVLSIYSAAGDTLTIMKIRLIGVSLNIVLDPIMIFGLLGFPALGIAGAAIATLLSDLISGVISLTLLSTRGIRGEKLRRSDLKPDFSLIKKFFRIGLPISISSLSDAAGFTVLTGIISMMGASALAAWGVGDRPFSLLEILVGSILAALSTIIGQNLGAENFGKAREAAYKALVLAVGITSVGVLTLITVRYEVARLFIPSDPEVIQHASDFILIMGPSIVFFVMLRAAYSVAQGSGHTKPVMYIAILRLWFLRNILAYLFGPGPLSLGVKGLWTGMAISNLITGLIALAWIVHGKWLKPVIKD
uniref:MATE family efflux transporter n=1 Tax=Thermosphaera aggregans TaxID=54254 RepID=A0A7C2BKR7_9CREN